MVEELKFSEMTNSELVVEKAKMEAEYEAIKSQIIKLTERLSELDKKYNDAEIEQQKRKALI